MWGHSFGEVKRIGNIDQNFPSRLLAPAEVRAASETVPAVQLKTISRNEAASVKVPNDACAPFCFAHSTAFSLFAEGDPIFTS